MYTALHVNVPVILVRLKKLIIFTGFGKNTQISNFMKIRPLGAEMFHADGRTDVTKIRVAFSNFANARRNHSRTRNTIFVIADKIKL
jgi:hypothetical protein